MKSVIRSTARLPGRDLPFVNGWRNTAIIALALGAMSLAVTLLLEPFGTDRYQAPLRTLRLAGGHFLPHLAGFLALHALDRQVYRLQGRRWRVYNALASRAGLIVVIITLSWLYNIRIINDIAPSWQYWADFVVRYGLPGVPVVAPLYLLMSVYLGRYHPEPPPGAGRMITISGRNRGERQRMPLASFVFAEAQQNYVAIHALGPDGARTHQVIRLSISELEQQIPGALRVHRSYLVNPAHITDVRGNARKREIVLKTDGLRLPVSTDFDISRIGVSSSQRG